MNLCSGKLIVSIQEAGFSTEFHDSIKSKSNFTHCSNSAQFLIAFIPTSINIYIESYTNIIF